MLAALPQRPATGGVALTLPGLMTCFTRATRNACRGRWLPGQKGRTRLSTHNNIADSTSLGLISGALYVFAAHPDRLESSIHTSQVLIYFPTFGQVPISISIFSFYTSHSFIVLSNMLLRSFLVSFIYATSLAAAASQSCYSLTGTPLDDTFAPCNPNAKHSGCCATNKASGADICLDSGLCMATQNQYMGTIWQPGCTDSSGKATECPQLCPGSMSIQINTSRGDHPLT
jgi:hypothetical protein